MSIEPLGTLDYDGSKHLRALLLKGINEIDVWMSNYINSFLCNVIIQPQPNSNGGLTKPPMKFCQG